MNNNLNSPQSAMNMPLGKKNLFNNSNVNRKLDKIKNRSVAVATYNMSFASDSGLHPDYMPSKDKPDGGNYASEAAFLKSIPQDGNSIDRRKYWKNALAMVKKFWEEVPNAGVIGLQELNRAPAGAGTGTDALQKLANEKKLEFATEQIIAGPVKTSVGLMWKPDIFGEKAAHMIKDLDYTPTEISGIAKQTGRPMLIVKTTKNYNLVSLHGPNQAKLAEKEQKDLKEAIKTSIQCLDSTAEADKIFIMGDFNDRYDAITSIDVPGGKVTYQGKAPLSCCHNWDSSCTDSRYKSLDAMLNRQKVGTCDATGKKLAGPGPREVLGVEGNIENYRYYGDKVFGASPASDIKIFPAGREGASKESDHEMVMAEFYIPLASTVNTGLELGMNVTNLFQGGYHKGKRHTRKHKAKKSHKKRGTRKH